MVDWDPKEELSTIGYMMFKFGGWVTVSSIPEWVRDASNPPKKTNIPLNGSVEKTFRGDSLEYKIITKRKPAGTRTIIEQEYKARIRPDK